MKQDVCWNLGHSQTFYIVPKSSSGNFSNFRKKFQNATKCLAREEKL